MDIITFNDNAINLGQQAKRFKSLYAVTVQSDNIDNLLIKRLKVLIIQRSLQRTIFLVLRQ